MSGPRISGTSVLALPFKCGEIARLQIMGRKSITDIRKKGSPHRDLSRQYVSVLA